MSDGSSKTTVLRHSDTWAGLALVLVGGLAGSMAREFDAISRPYPMALSLLLVGLGVLLIGKVLIGKAQHVSFAVPAQAALAATVIIALWIGAVSVGFGYLLPTFVMQFAFLLICGVRGPGKAAMIAAAVAGVSYLAFILGLGVRMPASLFPWLV